MKFLWFDSALAGRHWSVELEAKRLSASFKIFAPPIVSFAISQKIAPITKRAIRLYISSQLFRWAIAG